jgi:hypothetical protein
MPVRLSKSRVSAFRQCAKRLWLEIHKRDLISYGPATQRIFDVGHQVGEIARRQYPDGILIGSDDDLDQAIVETEAALLHRRPIFEATFRHDDVLVRADLLLPTGNGWHIAEVKSAASVKEYHVGDVATQVWVARGAGVAIERATVRHIDTSFVLATAGDYHGLFKDGDVMDGVAEMLPLYSKIVEHARDVVEGVEPSIVTGDHCSRPHSCPFQAYCESSEPPRERYPVAVPRAGKSLTEKQERINNANTSGTPYWDAAGAKAEIDAWPFPHFYLDFETTNPAVPVWLGARPYVQAPFQFSCHVLQADGSLTHAPQFLDLSGNDPSRACAEALLSLIGDTGAIVSYSSFEKTTINGLAKRFPDLAPRLEALALRVVDLMPVIKSHYYHRDMLGSYSIKAVLPTLVPHLDYSQLAGVRDGLMAQRAYDEAVAPGCSEERRAAIRRELEDYCGLDSLAMGELAKALRS